MGSLLILLGLLGVVIVVIGVCCFIAGETYGELDEYDNNCIRPFNVLYDWGFVIGLWTRNRPVKPNRVRRNQIAFAKRMGVKRADHDSDRG